MSSNVSQSNAHRQQQNRRRSRGATLLLLASATVLTDNASALMMHRNNLVSKTSQLPFQDSPTIMAERAPSVLDPSVGVIDQPNLLVERYLFRDRQKYNTNRKDATDKKNKFDDEWKLMIYNDEINTTEKVARVLVQKTGRSELEAFRIMKEAGRVGVSTVSTGLRFEIAEAYNEALRKEHLLSEILPVA